MAVVYRHIRLDKNVPFYIGIGKTENRAFDKKYSRNKIWKGIVNRTEYRVDILFNNLTWKEACEKEKEFIKLYGRIDLGLGTLCNMTNGGDGANGNIMSLEARKKIGESHKGEKHHQFGKKLSQEVKEKIRKTLSGRKLPDDVKKKVSETLKKTLMCEEQRKIKSKAGQKPIHPYYREDNQNWFVKFYRNKQKIYLGSFKTEQEAWSAIEEWKKNNEKVLSS
jgi:hypothetical protein